MFFEKYIIGTWFFPQTCCSFLCQFRAVHDAARQMPVRCVFNGEWVIHFVCLMRKRCVDNGEPMVFPNHKELQGRPNACMMRFLRQILLHHLRLVRVDAFAMNFDMRAGCVTDAFASANSF